METRSNRFLVFAVVGFLLLTLLAFAFWLFSASNPDGRDYLIRFKGGVDEGLRGVRRGAQSFDADVRDARPAIAAAQKKASGDHEAGAVGAT